MGAREQEDGNKSENNGVSKQIHNIFQINNYVVCTAILH